MTRADGRQLAPLFDTYVVVDWSARNQPAQGADSIWLAELTADGRLRLSNPPTRRDAEQSVWDLLDRYREIRVLLTIDVALGYPSGTAALFGLQEIPWMAMWSELARLATDDHRNRNNRFDVAAELNRRGGLDHGPFWGCPTGRTCHTLRPNKWAGGAVPVAEFRESERALRAVGRSPKSVWQLLGAGSVGGQTLTALPVLERYRSELGPRFGLWPFTTGLTCPAPVPGDVVVAEIWPSLFPLDDGPVGTVRDAAQVRATAQALASADRAGELASWFSIDVSDPMRDVVEHEEGWILAPPNWWGAEAQRTS